MNESYPRPFDVREVAKRRRRLPHWEVPNGTYFVTFRLADSIPQHVVARYEDERRRLMKSRRADDDGRLDRDQVRLYCQRIDRVLDKGIGGCELADSRIAPMVTEALEHFNERRYALHCYCLMPNHVHVVLSTIGDRPLAKITHSWKSFTAHKANEILSRRGQFWQDESFDHLVRTSEDLGRFVRYVLANPGKCGFVAWPWCRSFDVGTIRPDHACASAVCLTEDEMHRRDACATSKDA